MATKPLATRFDSASSSLNDRRLSLTTSAVRSRWRAAAAGRILGERRSHVDSFESIERMYEWAAAPYIVGIDISCAESANAMPTVAVLAAEGCYVSCAAGFADVLQAANAHLRHQ